MNQRTAELRYRILKSIWFFFRFFTRYVCDRLLLHFQNEVHRFFLQLVVVFDNKLLLVLFKCQVFIFIFLFGLILLDYSIDVFLRYLNGFNHLREYRISFFSLWLFSLHFLRSDFEYIIFLLIWVLLGMTLLWFAFVFVYFNDRERVAARLIKHRWFLINVVHKDRLEDILI